MRKQLRPVLVGLALLACVRPSFAAQASRIDSGGVSGPQFALFWDTQLSPGTPPLSNSFGTAYERTGADIVQRVMLDHSKKVYFGYGVRVEVTGPGSYRVTFQPLALSPAFAQRVLEDPADWRMLPSPAFPAPRIVQAGEVLELKLLTNPGWGQTLVEYVTVQEPDQPQGFRDLNAAARKFTYAAGNPRDLRLDDVPLQLNQPRVSENGRFLAASANVLADAEGPVIWLYLPGRGRILLSLTPRTANGFKKIGEVRGTTMRLTLGKDVISVSSALPIAPAAAALNIYGLIQPAWKPTYEHANTAAVIVDTAEPADYAATR